MNGFAIRAEVAGAIREGARATGDGELIATLTRQPFDQPQNPWDQDIGSFTDTWEVAVLVSEYDARHIDGELIRATDRKVLMEAGPVVPNVADRLTIGEDEYTIMAVEPLSPGYFDLRYVLRARR